MQIDITQLRTDGGTQPRAMYHYGMVDAYAEDMDAGVTFPPVVVFYDGSDYWLADGFHRVLAARKIERTAIDADVRQGTQQDAQWYSYSVNQAHGLRRSNDDKRRAVEAALKHLNAAGMSDRQIAEHCGVSQPFVSELRNRVSDNGYQSTGNGYRAGKDGVKRKAPNKKPKPAPAQQDEDDEPLTPYEEHIAAQYTTAAPDPLVLEVDRLVLQYSYDDLSRLVELLAERIAVNA